MSTDLEPESVRSVLVIDQLQPLVVPQLGQAWQLPARCMVTPHCMHIGASWLTEAGAKVATRASASSVVTDSMEGGSEGISEP